MSTERQPSTTPSAIRRLPYGSSTPLRTQSAGFWKPQNVGEFSKRMSVAASRVSFPTVYRIPSNRSSSLLLL
jgi:hypothetical protein